MTKPRTTPEVAVLQETIRGIEQRLVQFEVSEISGRIAWRSVLFALSKRLIQQELISVDSWNDMISSLVEGHYRTAWECANPCMHKAFLSIAAEIDGLSATEAKKVALPNFTLMQGGKE